MFSYDAILCWNNGDFWDNLAKDEQHWAISSRKSLMTMIL